MVYGQSLPSPTFNSLWPIWIVSHTRNVTPSKWVQSLLSYKFHYILFIYSYSCFTVMVRCVLFHPLLSRLFDIVYRCATFLLLSTMLNKTYINESINQTRVHEILKMCGQFQHISIGGIYVFFFFIQYHWFRHSMFELYLETIAMWFLAGGGVGVCVRPSSNMGMVTLLRMFVRTSASSNVSLSAHYRATIPFWLI